MNNDIREFTEGTILKRGILISFIKNNLKKF